MGSGVRARVGGVGCLFMLVGVFPYREDALCLWTYVSDPSIGVPGKDYKDP